jgi:hypothetical protein
MESVDRPIPKLAELYMLLHLSWRAYSGYSSVSPERSLPVSGKGISGLHAPSGHLWRRPGRGRFTHPRPAVATPRARFPEGLRRAASQWRVALYLTGALAKSPRAGDLGPTRARVRRPAPGGRRRACALPIDLGVGPVRPVKRTTRRPWGLASRTASTDRPDVAPSRPG